MNTEMPEVRRPWLIALPLILFATLWIAASTRELVLAQLTMLFNSPEGFTWTLRQLGVTSGLPEGDPEDEEGMIKEATSQKALDYQIQLGAALKAEWTPVHGKADERVTRLVALAGRFPNRSVLYAHILRFATDHDVKIRRNAEYQAFITNSAPVPTPEDIAPELISQRLKEYDSYAQTGEMLAPDNAYFPMMRAVGLFASHRDTQAIEAIHRAARMSHWDDHVDDEAEAEWALERVAFGNHEAALHAALQSTLSYPHLNALRDLSHMTLYMAMQAEEANHPAEGFAIRHDMMRCGSLMRSQSRSLVGALTGFEILQTQALQPGGGGAEEDLLLSTEKRAQKRLDAYENYLRKIGHPEETTWIKNEIAAGKQVEAVQRSDKATELSPYGSQVKRLIAWWMGDFVFLTNALEMTLLGLVGVLMARKRSNRNAALGIALLAVWVLFLIVAEQTQWGAAFGALRSVFTEKMAHNGNVEHASFLTRTIDSLSNGFVVDNALIGFTLTVPLLTLVLLWRLSRRWKDDLALVVIEGIAGPGVLVATVFMLLTIGSVAMTVHDEARINTALDRALANEGRYLAERANLPWPQ